MSDTKVTGSVAICTHCGAANRVAAGKALSAGKCGKCGEPLATQKPADITGDMLNRLIAKDTGAFVLDVWAPWCGPCLSMAPAYAAATAELEPHVRLIKLNSDAEQAAASRLSIRGIPTMILFAKGREVARTSGAMGTGQIVQWVRDHLPAVGA